MADLSLVIIDKFIEILTVKEKNKEKYFNNFIEPMFKDAEIIVKDYMELFIELIEKLEKDEETDEIIKWIEKRRYSLLPARTKVRALLKEKNYNLNFTDNFQKGIWGLMKGGVSFIETGHAKLQEYDMGTHTILDILTGISSGHFINNKEFKIGIAKKQLRAIELAWQDVSKGYAKIKQMKLT